MDRTEERKEFSFSILALCSLLFGFVLASPRRPGLRSLAEGGSLGEEGRSDPDRLDALSFLHGRDGLRAVLLFHLAPLQGE